MAVTLDPTVAGASANAYADVAFADAYFGERMYSEAWTNIVSADLKKQALITATRRLDLLNYKGRPTTETQALRWPREYVPREDTRAEVPPDFEYGAHYWPKDEIPVKVKQATCELALWLVNKASDPSVPDPLRAFNSVSLPGGLSLSLRGSEMPSPDEIPLAVSRLLAEFRHPMAKKVVRS